MHSKRIVWPFRRLRGKLTFSYTLTLVATFLIVEVLSVGASLLVSSINVPYFVLNILKQEAPQAPPYFVHGSPDREALTAWLQATNANVPNKQGPFDFAYPIFLCVVDTHGQTVAEIGTHPLPIGTAIAPYLPAQNRTELHTVLHTFDSKAVTANIANDGNFIAMYSIVGPNGTILGALVMKIAQPAGLQLVNYFFTATILAAIGVTFVAMIAGMISGYVTSRGFTKRLKGLSTAADRWSHGDFSVLIHDTSEDELGQAARQLNAMAEQLQNLLQARQKLATLEERNRLARDLHDSVKQQIFSVVMQIGATKLLLKRDTVAAELRLNEAEKLVKQAQQELTSLIRELRPVALEGKGLVVALRELTAQWAQQNEIVANVQVEGAHSLPLTVEEALYRVAQEALSNIARHSKADLVQITLATTDDTVTLTIIDNGQGFDATQSGRMGVGLHSMRERMKVLGGDVQIKSAPGKGTGIVTHCKRLGTRAPEAVTAPIEQRA